MLRIPCNYTFARPHDGVERGVGDLCVADAEHLEKVPSARVSDSETTHGVI